MVLALPMGVDIAGWDNSGLLSLLCVHRSRANNSLVTVIQKNYLNENAAMHITTDSCHMAVRHGMCSTALGSRHTNEIKWIACEFHRLFPSVADVLDCGGQRSTPG